MEKEKKCDSDVRFVFAVLGVLFHFHFRINEKWKLDVMRGKNINIYMDPDSYKKYLSFFPPTSEYLYSYHGHCGIQTWDTATSPFNQLATGTSHIYPSVSI